ncbi:MAG TPA: PAS domain-containing protein, partial [Verrucomicrobiae bacterium]|nr:PAS domain-containing protein [Verrucomicrobiae bacterium]
MKISVRRKHQPARQISWEQILINLDAGVVTVDLDGKIGFFNEAAEVLTEISSAATLGQPLEQIFKREPWLIDLVRKTRPPRQESTRGEGDFLSR